MTWEEKNLKIAEFRGWKPRHDERRCDGVHLILCGACGQMGHGNCYGHGIDKFQVKCADAPCCDEVVPPDHFGSLDVMHEAEKTLTAEQMCLYAKQLHRLGPLGGWVFLAPAAQRFEAFGLALKLWGKGD